MRKVLLATTALVAMGGVSAASADISLSMSSEFKYSTYSDNTGTATDKDSYASTQDLVVSGSAAFDNGMSGSVSIDMDEGGNADGGFSITGDFGTVAFNDMGYDGGTAADVTADEANYLAATWNSGTALATEIQMPADEQIPEATVSWAAPAVSGFTLGLGMTDGATNAADGNQWGVTYAMNAGSMDVTVAYASSSAGGGSANDASSAGVTVVSGDATIKVARNEIDTYEASSVGASYKVSDALTVQAYTGTTEKSDTAAYEVKDTGIGLTYTVTTGLTISVTNNDFTGKGGTAGAESGTRTVIALDATF